MRAKGVRIGIALLAAAFLVVSLGASARAQRGPIRVVVALNGEPATLDGHDMLAHEREFFPQVYDKLVEFNERAQVVPQLATSWTFTPDGKVYTFKLRQGVKFHDGTPVTSDGVKRAFDRLMNPENRLPRRAVFSMLERVEVVDLYTVRFILKEPFGAFLATLANPSASIVNPYVAERLGRDRFKATPSGSGPFRFAEWTSGNRIVLRKVPDHWESATNNIDEIVFRFVPEENARAVGLETGELDVVLVLPPAEAVRLRGNPKIQVINAPLARIQGLYVNMRKKPFSELKVRHAMAHAIDKKAIVDNFLRGFGRVADSPLPQGVWPYKAQKVYDFDLERAKKLMAEAGYAGGFRATMWVPVGTYTASQQISEALAGMLKKINIDLKLDIRESAQWLSELRTRGVDEMSYYGWGNQSGDADYSLRTNFLSTLFAPQCCNRQFYRNPEVDALLMKGASAVDPRERRQAYEKVQELLWQEQPWVYISTINRVSANTRRVKNVVYLPTEWIHLRNARVE
ncbi:MAG: hypothetical protein HY660_09860 [Armatimonadetes bacterium]|nr:hypothetical protein [Armatimonadota bacterium]